MNNYRLGFTLGFMKSAGIEDIERFISDNSAAVGAGTGALIGAGTGALMGGKGNRGMGALGGGILGTVGGTAIGTDQSKLKEAIRGLKDSTKMDMDNLRKRMWSLFSLHGIGPYEE